MLVKCFESVFNKAFAYSEKTASQDTVKVDFVVVLTAHFGA